MKFAVRKDIYNVDKTIEHLWLEVKGRNKNNSFLLGVLYQPSPVDSDKHQWLDKFDNILSFISTIWTGSIVLANTAITERYQEMITNHNLTVHIHFRIFSTERKIFRGPNAQYDFFFRKNRTAHAIRGKFSVPW